MSSVIYICADDYGISPISSKRIIECAKNGSLNKISVFPNFGLTFPLPDIDVHWSLHLNLVEGKCMSDPREISLIAREDGTFRHTFFGLFFLSVLRRKELEKQVCRELRAQITYWRENVSLDKPIFLDSHQHTHMIPSVFRMLTKVIRDEKIPVEYLRIPAEPVMPYIMTPALYFTYSAVNVIKQWLLKSFWQINKKQAGNIKTAYFFGILFSGSMDEKRVKKVLPHYIKKAARKNADIEILFHPGFLEDDEKTQNTVFDKFYYSEGRKKEYEAVHNINKKEACK